MLTRLLLLLAAALLTIPAHAQGVMIDQVSPDAKPVKRKHRDDLAATAAEPQVRPTIGDELGAILQDHKMSELGRANEAISSQYNGQPIVETPDEEPAKDKLKIEKPKR